MKKSEDEAEANEAKGEMSKTVIAVNASPDIVPKPQLRPPAVARSLSNRSAVSHGDGPSTSKKRKKTSLTLKVR